ncbi:hypothetical protein [Sphingopyxis fribergensis]
MKRLPDLGEPAAPFDGALKARKQFADDAFEEWLYAPDEGEGIAEETEQQALEAQWAEEDLKLRLQTAGYIGIPAVFIGVGIVSLFTTSWSIRIPFMWGFMNLPLLTLAVITWRRRELRFGLKRPVKGRKARIVAVLLVLFSFVSFALAVAQAMMLG